jgi:DNA polymerase-4
MPLRTAARKCPDAVFLPSDKPAYEAASARVMNTLRSLPVVVEEWGWDEAVVGASTDDPEALAREIQRRVHAETGLTCAVGIGETRLQAKTATGFAKPGGIARLTRATWLATMGDKPVTALWGIGARTAARLAEAGIRTVNELAQTDHNELATRFGPTIGPNLRLLAIGGHASPIEGQPHVPRSRSRETTYERDLTDSSEIEAQVAALAREVTDSVVAEGRRITHVAVKVRTATFFTRSRIRKLREPTVDPAVVATVARGMLDLFELHRPIRLLGVRVVLDS